MGMKAMTTAVWATMLGHRLTGGVARLQSWRRWRRRWRRCCNSGCSHLDSLGILKGVGLQQNSPTPSFLLLQSYSLFPLLQAKQSKETISLNGHKFLIASF
jgi:hypothetical protein